MLELQYVIKYGNIKLLLSFIGIRIAIMFSRVGK
jgi:hypothetical protein